jgi:hypothetical protein
MSKCPDQQQTCTLADFNVNIFSAKVKCFVCLFGQKFDDQRSMGVSTGERSINRHSGLDQKKVCQRPFDATGVQCVGIQAECAAEVRIKNSRDPLSVEGQLQGKRFG